ncbi:MAG: hypothetical protein P2A85_18230 [Microcoleus anatoxicus]|uniref:hypothetical protein n=1 Tax=Microcoleus anatoxicus TaxID=2705319 RepID=UPI00366B24CC
MLEFCVFVISSIQLMLKHTIETVAPTKAIILRVPTVAIALAMTIASIYLAMAPWA